MESTFKFNDGLDAVERDADAGLVPGETDAWCERVLERVDALDALWLDRRAARGELYEVMRGSDPAMSSRIDALYREDEELYGRFKELRRQLRQLGEFEEPEPYAEVAELRSELVHYVADVRAYEGAVLTWFNEALYRDRGDAD